MSKSKAGFTLIEMVIIIPMAAFVIMGMIKIAIDLSASAIQTNTVTARTNDLQSALDIIEQDVSLSVRFLLSNEFEIDSSQTNSGQGYLVKTATGEKQLILRTLLTTDNPLDTDSDKNLVHSIEGGSPDCMQNIPLFTNTVYYIRDGDLYRRVLFKTDYLALACPGQIPYQQPTCKTGTGDFCKTEDMLILKDANFEFDFMTAANPDTPIMEIFNTTLDSNVRSDKLGTATILRVKLTSSVTTVEGDNPSMIRGALRVNRIE